MGGVQKSPFGLAQEIYLKEHKGIFLPREEKRLKRK